MSGMHRRLVVFVGGLVMLAGCLALPSGAVPGHGHGHKPPTTTTTRATTTTVAPTTTRSTSSTTTSTSSSTTTTSRSTTSTSSSTSSTTASSTSTTTTTLPAGTGFVGRNGTHLTLNGAPYTFTGLNIFNATSVGTCGPTFSTLNADPTGDGLDTNLTKIGPLKAFRTWFFESVATVGNNTTIDWRPFDNTLLIAKRHGMKVIATLENQWGDCESSGYKSSSWYTSGYKAANTDGPLTYRNYVAQVVARYKNDPTILAWQEINEGENCDQAGFDAWASDMARLIKGIDPNHLVSVGTIGSGQCGSANSTDYRNLHASPFVDLCEYHDYESATLPSHLSSDLSVCAGLGKPLFVGESGIKPCNVGGTFQNRADAFRAKFSAQMPAVVGELPWNWDGGASQQCGYLIGPGDPTLGVLQAFG